MLTPRERFNIALDHQEPDRIPLDLGGFKNEGWKPWATFDEYPIP